METKMYENNDLYTSFHVLVCLPGGSEGSGRLLIKSDECIVINKYYLILFLNYDYIHTLLSLV